MKKMMFVFWICLITVSACSSPEKRDSAKDYQTISALGDTLRASSVDTRQANNLADLERTYQKDSADLNALIKYGQALAESGNHTKATTVFSKGIKQSENNPLLYLHRGQQYITLRKFDKAIHDFQEGIDIVNKSADQAENYHRKESLIAQLQYKLGVTYYLQGNYNQSREVLEECLNSIDNSEMGVAASYWLYMSLRRMGKDGMAGEILKPIAVDMNLHKNKAYHQVLMVFKGVFKPDMLFEKFKENDPLGSPIIGYGLGNWHYINGRKQRARQIFQEVYEGSQWDSPGYIAAEEDLAKLFGN